MEHRRLGKSGLKVSEIGLGGSSFGASADEGTTIGIINQALDMGVNSIDTAEMYAQGRSEELIGKAVKGKRSRVIIASKFGHPRTVAPDQQGGSRSYIVKAVESSLRRLNTDYIDLYYFHHPDQETPNEETLSAMDTLVRTGKVRYIGCSRFAAWQLSDALWTSRLNNLESFIVVQEKYHLLDRTIEREIVPCCQTHGVGVIPYGPLAGGFLTGRYRREEMAMSMELTQRVRIYRDVLTNENFDKLARLEAFAEERSHKVGELAMAWLLSKPWVGSIIAGVTSLEQFRANMAATDWRLTEEDKTQLDKII
jgi:aryl-alcohol dehydrogenase-like predicted oxidoreductase